MFKIGDRVIVNYIPDLFGVWEKEIKNQKDRKATVVPCAEKFDRWGPYLYVQMDDPYFTYGIGGRICYVREQDLTSLKDPNDILKELLK